LLPGEIEQVNKAASSNSLRSASSIANAPWRVPAAPTLHRLARLAITRPLAAFAQIAAKWLLPEPSGPTNAMARAGQSAQRSIRQARSRCQVRRENRRGRSFPDDRARRLSWRGKAGSLMTAPCRAPSPFPCRGDLVVAPLPAKAVSSGATTRVAPTGEREGASHTYEFTSEALICSTHSRT